MPVNPAVFVRKTRVIRVQIINPNRTEIPLDTVEYLFYPIPTIALNNPVNINPADNRISSILRNPR